MSINSIVQVNVAQNIAGTPSNLQKTGCFVSQGGTTLQPGSLMLLTNPSSLSSVLSGNESIAGISWSDGVVTVETSTNHGITVGDTVVGVITGCVPTGYNGTFSVTATNTNILTYSLANNPGAISVKGVFTTENIAELAAMNTTFWAQGDNNAVYVLELGSGTPAQGVLDLISYIAAPDIQMYSYLVPMDWADESTAITMARNLSSNTAKVYFYVTTSLSNYENWKGIKSVIALTQDVNAPSTEFSNAAVFWQNLNNSPSDVNKVPPMAFRYLVGVTPFSGTQSQQIGMRSNNINYVGTGAEGGISKELILWGVNADGHDISEWYAADWLQINIDLAIANAIINGSNNVINPLYFNQQGINTLQQVAQGVYNRSVVFGLSLSGSQVNAVDFVTYTANNPEDYALGEYNGLSITYTTARGFIRIVFNVTVSF